MCGIVAIVLYHKVCKRIAAEPELCDASGDELEEEHPGGFGLKSYEWFANRSIARLGVIEITFEDV